VFVDTHLIIVLSVPYDIVSIDVLLDTHMSFVRLIVDSTHKCNKYNIIPVRSRIHMTKIDDTG
jgi:hypothetical protein